MGVPIELRSGAGTTLNCETTNVSSSGVLFRSDAGLLPGDQVEYMITLPGRAPESNLLLRCRGRIVRRTSDGDIAATVERWEFLREPA